MKNVKIVLAFLILLVILAFTLYVYRNLKYEDYPELITNDNELEKKLTILNEPFKVNFFYETNILTAFYAYIKNDGFNYEKEVINNNGILICLYKHMHFKNAPLIILFPGVYGTVTNFYITNFVELAYKNGLNVVCVQFQYQFEDPELIEQIKKISFYSICNISDTKFAIDYIHKNYEYSQLCIMGYSNGAYLTTKYLQENQDIDFAAAIIISSPWDIKANLEFLNSATSKKMYKNNFISSFKDRVKNFAHLLPAFKKQHPKFDLERIHNPQNMHDLIYPDYFYHNYKSLDDYLAECKILDVSKIKPSVLYIHAKDDPVCNWKNMPIDDIMKTKKDSVILFEKGGHLGWHYYLETICLQYFNYFLKKSPDNSEQDV